MEAPELAHLWNHSMLKINRKQKVFSKLPKPTLSEVDITERYDLQECIFNSPETFFGEIRQNLFVIGKEVCPSNDVQDRIDLLAVDQDGNAVIIELKRGNHKLQLLQAISYAGMIAKWTPDDFLTDLDDQRTDELTDFLGVEKEDINRSQRIILIAEGFDYSVLIASEWLSGQYGVDISCCGVSLAVDENSHSEYLSCSHVFPTPELVQVSVQRHKKKKGLSDNWKDWETALSVVTNEDVVGYFQNQLQANRWNYLHNRVLKYRVNGDHRLSLYGKNKFAYGIQFGRFDGDIDIWKNGLGNPETVTELNKKTRVRFRLFTKADFAFFDQTVTKNLSDVEWVDQYPEDNGDFVADNS